MTKQRTIVSIYFIWAIFALGPYVAAEELCHATKGVTSLSIKKHLPGRTSNGQEPVQGSHGSVKFDEYGLVRSKEERKRLSDFAIQLKAQPNTQAYIIAYGGRRSWAGKANCRAVRAKNYLVQSRGIDRHRIVTVDGGYREEPATGLYIRLQGGEPPVAFPTLDPNKVRIIKTGRRPKKKCPAL